MATHTERLEFNCPPWVVQCIDRMCDEEQRTRAAMVRLIVMRALNDEPENPATKVRERAG